MSWTSAASAAASWTQPNPPAWPRSVLVVSPEDSEFEVERRLAMAGASSLRDGSRGHFSRARVAVLFKPGRYSMDVQVGYYMQVAGLGAGAGEVVFDGPRGVYCDATDTRPDGAGSLDTFWRSAENFEREGSMKWAVSQAAPLRRVHVTQDLVLHDGAFYASGGFLAACQVDGTLRMGSQQQWVSRNANLPHTSNERLGGAWAFTFVGADAPRLTGTAPGDDDEAPAINVVDETPVVAEKPFVVLLDADAEDERDKGGSTAAQKMPPTKEEEEEEEEEEDRFGLVVPDVLWSSRGTRLDQGGGRIVPFERVFVADAAKHDSKAIQAAVDAGLDVVFTPGVYALAEALVVTTPNQVLLGLGLATLLAPKTSEPCLRVAAKVPGVRLAGLVLQATTANEDGAEARSMLLDWGGGRDDDPGDENNPGVLSDVYCRVGGDDVDTSVSADVMVRISSGHVVGDNLWLWRADHSALQVGEAPQPGEVYHLVQAGECQSTTGLEVTGPNVTIHGLAVEHTLGDGVHWAGEEGQVFFFQAELPYDATPDYADQGHVAYRVAPHVQKHTCVGAGVYSFFRDHAVTVPTAIHAPPAAHFPNAFTRHLDGQGRIATVLNATHGRGVGAGRDAIARLN